MTEHTEVAHASRPWTGPWQPSPEYTPSPINNRVNAQQYVVDNGRYTPGPYVEAIGPDRALIQLAPEMAEAILEVQRVEDASIADPRDYTETWDNFHRVADKLRAIGGVS